MGINVFFHSTKIDCYFIQHLLKYTWDQIQLQIISEIADIPPEMFVFYGVVPASECIESNEEFEISHMKKHQTLLARKIFQAQNAPD
jgi:hypothetical protein